MRIVRLYCYDPVKDATARLRFEYDSDSDAGAALLSDEDTLAGQVDNPDANVRNVLASIDLGVDAIRWLHTVTGELLPKMERGRAEGEARERDEQPADPRLVAAVHEHLRKHLRKGKP
jgi:hypothetical protein